MNIDLRSVRQEYNKKGLSRDNIPTNPFLLFEQWLAEAISSQVNEPTAMLVGTVSPQGQPATRTVLLKELRAEQFVFYTNYNSRKGQHLQQNPAISLSFVWHELERQVHIEGKASKLASNISDEYFHSRPFNSQIGARASLQSQYIESRNELMQRFEQESALWKNKEVPRPENWGGISILPHRFEFWQGRPSRLHDRFLYELDQDKQWHIHRLSP